MRSSTGPHRVTVPLHSPWFRSNPVLLTRKNLSRQPRCSAEVSHPIKLQHLGDMHKTKKHQSIALPLPSKDQIWFLSTNVRTGDVLLTSPGRQAVLPLVLPTTPVSPSASSRMLQGAWWDSSCRSAKWSQTSDALGRGSKAPGREVTPMHMGWDT